MLHIRTILVQYCCVVPIYSGVSLLFYSMKQKTYILLLSVALIVALIPRLWLWYDQGSAGMIYPGDQDEYYRGAIHILLQGDYYDTGQWLRPPITSLFLAGIFALVGVNVPLAMLIQCFVNAATLLLIAEIARRIWASRLAGVMAGLATALFLPYASLGSQLMSETLFIFLMTTALLVLEIAHEKGMGWQWLFAGGIAWGLAALTRPVGVYAVPLVMLWAWWRAWSITRTSATQGLGKHFVHSMQQPLALLVGFVLVVSPWTIRNYMVYQHVVLVDTNGGISFWLGNLLEPEERELQGYWNQTIPNSAERQQVALKRAFDNIQQDPALFLKRLRYKTVSLWQLDTRLFVSNAPIGITLDERSLWFAVVSDMQYVVLMVLALVGVVYARPKELSWILLGWILYGTLLSAVSLGHPRLRLPLIMTMFVYAALPLAHPRMLWQRIKIGSYWRHGALLVGLGIFAFLIYAQAYIPFVKSQYWLLQAKFGAGETAIQNAIAAAPDNYLPYVALGDLQRKQGEYTDALSAYAAAVERAPQNTYSHLWRFALLRQMGDMQAAGAAMQAIADVGWNNNQLYAWAWDRMPFYANTRLSMNTPAPGLMRGFSAPQQDKEHVFRWTTGNAKIRLRWDETKSTSPSHLNLVLRSDIPDTMVEVLHQGIHLQTLYVGTDWETYMIPLSATVSHATELSMYDIFELRSPTFVVSPLQPYPHGVAVAGANFE